MKALPECKNLNPKFWAHVKRLSEGIGYTAKADKKEGIPSRIKVPTDSEVYTFLNSNDYATTYFFDENQQPNENGKRLLKYFSSRADMLNNEAEKFLMDEDEARKLFEKTRNDLNSDLPIIMNKQKKEKRKPAYLANIIGMIVDHYSGDFGFVNDPKSLTVFTDSGNLIETTLSRRFDGAFPTVENPISLWEIKEYYYTTTFGSRIADGVYESLLDGLEIRDLFTNTGKKVLHYIMVDSHRTFWNMGKSYLCRYFDLLNMGFADEVLFGSEIASRLPQLEESWVVAAHNR